MSVNIDRLCFDQDMLISLKKLVIQRAEVIGHPDLATKVDLKMLRALGTLFLTFFCIAAYRC